MKNSDGMGIKILIVVTCSPDITKVNITVLTKLNLETRFVAYLRFLIIWTKIYFCTNYFQFIVRQTLYYIECWHQPAYYSVKYF